MPELPAAELPALIVDTLRALVGRDIKDVDLHPNGQTIVLYDHTGREHFIAIIASDRVQCPECEGGGLMWLSLEELAWTPADNVTCPTCAGEGTVPAPENNLRGSAA